YAPLTRLEPHQVGGTRAAGVAPTEDSKNLSWPKSSESSSAAIKIAIHCASSGAPTVRRRTQRATGPKGAPNLSSERTATPSSETSLWIATSRLNERVNSAAIEMGSAPTASSVQAPPKSFAPSTAKCRMHADVSYSLLPICIIEIDSY